MATYKVPCQWTVFGDMYIEADSMEEAIEQAYGDEPLPEENDYLSGSIMVLEDEVQKVRE